MPIFREKTVTVEAHQWDGTAEKAREIVQWAYPSVRYWGAGKKLTYDSGVGVLAAFQGDWIIKQDGEFFACEPGMFEQVYEPAVESLEGGGVYWK